MTRLAKSERWCIVCALTEKESSPPTNHKERTMTDKSDKIVLLSKQDVMNIVTLFADKGNPEDGVEYQGNRYGIVFRDGHYRLYMFDGIALCLEHK